MSAGLWWRRAALLGLGLTVGGIFGLAVGVELTRRWPLEPVEKFLERFSIAVRPLGPWSFRARAEYPHYESLAAVVDGRLLVFGGFDTPAIEATPRVEAYDPETDSWQRLGDMPAVPTHANAVVRNGEVWVAGGFVGDHPGPATAETWRYDPATDTWHPGPPLPAPRGGGGLALADDGALHYFGGWLPDRVTDSPDHWRLGPGDSVWVAAAPLPVPRGHFGTVTLAGFIYAIGGCTTHDLWPVDLAHVHRYDPATDQWTAVASLPRPRSHHEPGTFVHEGLIYLVGGRDNTHDEGSVGEIIAYDPINDSWSYAATMPRPLTAPVARPINDVLLVAMGGEGGPYVHNRQTWALPLRERWSPAPDMPVALGEVAGGVIGTHLYLVGQGAGATLRFDLGSGRWLPEGTLRHRPIPGHHHAAEVWGGELYLLGGLIPGSTRAVQIYDPASNAWRYGPPLPFPTGSAASALIGDQIYLAGGIVGDTTSRQAVRLDLATGEWHAIAPMPRARNHAAAGTDGRRLFIFGGRGPGSGDANIVANGYDDVQIYDPGTDTWVSSGDGPNAPLPVPQARGGMGKAVFLDGLFYILGGETLDGPGATEDRVYSRVDIYDPEQNQWREGPLMPTARHGIFPLAFGRTLWVAGGGVVAARSASATVELFRPE